VDIWSVKVLRWASSGSYDYTVTYRFHNTFSQPMTVAVADATLLGPNGETLGGTVPAVLMPAPETVGAGLYSVYRNLTVDDDDVTHPFAEKVRLRVSHYPAGGVIRTAEGIGQVLHGPQTARLMNFELSTDNPIIGQPITVRWNVQSARQVGLRTPVLYEPNEPGTRGLNFDEAVESVGARTFVVKRQGQVWFELNVDNGLIVRTLTVYSQ